MEFIIAEQRHLDEICRITAQAKEQLKAMGLDQWQKGYPSGAVWESDIENKRCLLAAEEDKVLGVFAYQTTPDPSYSSINGAWLTNAPYASMHRVCVSDDCKGKGVAGKMFAHGFKLAADDGFRSLRIDTHPGNTPMQRALEKAGFQRCGEIVLVGGCEDGDLRIAYEKLL